MTARSPPEGFWWNSSAARPSPRKLRWGAVVTVRTPDVRHSHVWITSGGPVRTPAHPHRSQRTYGDVAIVHAFRGAGMGVGICTDATTLDDAQIGELAGLGVHCNVRWTGSPPTRTASSAVTGRAFAVTAATAEKLGAAGILQGLLCTPNTLAENEEYARLCAFVRANGRGMCCSTRWAAWAAGARRRARWRRRRRTSGRSSS